VLVGGFARRGADGLDWLALRVEAGGLTAPAWRSSAAGHAASAQRCAGRGSPSTPCLVATGVWFGGLVPLLLLGSSRTLPGAAATRLCAAATRRFSMAGLVSVGLLVATGVFSAWSRSALSRPRRDAPYGRWLCLKLALPPCSRSPR
jgi:putative copper export protein